MLPKSIFFSSQKNQCKGLEIKLIRRAFRCKYCGQYFKDREEARAHDSQLSSKGKQNHRVLRISMGEIEYEKTFSEVKNAN